MITIEEIQAERIDEFWEIQFGYLVDDGMVVTEEEKIYFSGSIALIRARMENALSWIFGFSQITGAVGPAAHALTLCLRIQKPTVPFIML